jgi:hypothetical protein
MIKRPLNSRFSAAVREGRKITTIRDNPWPLGKPIMLYNWSGAAYRSPQINVAAVLVERTTPITISRLASGAMIYSFTTGGNERLINLWKCEGFDSWQDMDAWFAAKMKPGQQVTKHLMCFSLANKEATTL